LNVHHFLSSVPKIMKHAESTTTARIASGRCTCWSWSVCVACGAERQAPVAASRSDEELPPVSDRSFACVRVARVEPTLTATSTPSNVVAL
jgi:hypothetical protein